MLNKLITVIVLSALSFSISAATYNTQSCGLNLVCFTGISNFESEGSFYDISFEYGTSEEVLSGLGDLSRSEGVTTFVNGSSINKTRDFSLAAAFFLQNTYGASATQAVFSSPDLVHQEATFFSLAWVKWQDEEYNTKGHWYNYYNDMWFRVYKDDGSFTYMLDVHGSDFWTGYGENPNSYVASNSYCGSSACLQMVVTPSAVPLPSAVWLFGSAFIGLIASRRNQDKIVY